MMEEFRGFQESKKRFTGIPDQFFREIMPAIDDINELKLVMYVLWSAYKQGDFGTGFSLSDFEEDRLFMGGLDPSDNTAVLEKALEKAVNNQILIKVNLPDGGDTLYFINSPRGRTAAALAKKGQELAAADKPGATLDLIQPNIYRLYEENIGPLTPMIAEALREAEDAYPAEWIEEAVEIAVKNNVRRLSYIEKILERWQEEGRNGTHQRDDEEDYRRYLKGEYGDIGLP